MCGRYTVMAPFEELEDRFQIDVNTTEYVPRYNAAPGQEIFAVIERRGERRLGRLKWGLIPSWAKDMKIGNKLINARAETVEEKLSFQRSLQRRRCLIPADGFYEWRKREDGGKRPMRIRMKDGRLFAMAALYDTWTAPDGRRVASCTILTTEPNALVLPLHNRMPVILRPEDEPLWLDEGTTDPAALRPLFVPYPAGEMDAYPVHSKVGNPANDTPDCADPFAWQ